MKIALARKKHEFSCATQKAHTHTDPIQIIRRTLPRVILKFSQKLYTLKPNIWLNMNYQVKKKLNIQRKQQQRQQQIIYKLWKLLSLKRFGLQTMEYTLHMHTYVQYILNASVCCVCVSCCLYNSLNHLSNVNPMFLTVVASINVQTTVFKTACQDLFAKGLNIFNQLIALLCIFCAFVQSLRGNSHSLFKNWLVVVFFSNVNMYYAIVMCVNERLCAKCIYFIYYQNICFAIQNMSHFAMNRDKLYIFVAIKFLGCFLLIIDL